MKAALVVLIVGGLCGIAFWQRDLLINAVDTAWGNATISESEIVKAEKNLRRLLESSQNSYIHRQEENRRMARSMEELGDGVNGAGCIIYADVWYSRVGGERDLDRLNAEMRDRIAKIPYSYAILAMEGVYGGRADELSCLIVAVPKTKDYRPMLVEEVGPLQSDPADFHKSWPIHKIMDEITIEKIRQYVLQKKSCDKKLLELVKDNTKH